MADLKINLGKGLILDNPVMTASGTFGYGREYSDFVDLSRLGAVIVKGTTLHPRQGNPYPRMAETPSGMLNAVGLQNPGAEHFVKVTYPEIIKDNFKIIVNVSGSCPEDYAAVCEMLADLDKVAAVEINISCPNVKQGGMAFGTTASGAAEITRTVRQAYPGHVMMKLSPNVTDITEIARAVEAEGADSVSLINTLLGMAVDVERMKPILSTVTGGLSGPCVRPVAVRMVWQVAKSVNIPVVGLGGITCARDAVEFMLAGASAVQVGTANFIDPGIGVRIVDGIAEYCDRHGIDRAADLRHCLKN